MVLTLIVGVLASAAVFWAYVRSAPAHAAPSSLRLWSAGTGMAALAACGVLGAYFYSTVAHSADRPWWPILTVLGSVFVVPMVVLASSFLRWVVFR